jgi:hypothetical protein
MVIDMIKKFNIYFILAFIIINFSTESSAWKTNSGDPEGTHEMLSRYSAVYFSSLKTCTDSANINCGKLLEIGFKEELDELLLWEKNKQAWEWLIWALTKKMPADLTIWEPILPGLIIISITP